MTISERVRGVDDPHQILDPTGTLVDGAVTPDLDDGTLVDLYRDMLLTRRFDERAVSLQRQGRMGTYPPAAGQEAAQVGSTYALREDDPICYQYREHGAVVARGIGPEYLLYWMGYEEGNAWLADKGFFPINIGIGGQVPHATGIAWASKLMGDDHVTVCHFGDGATSEGDFHEGMNFAGVFEVPAVFICNNNQWAISIPEDRQTRSATFAQKAIAYGFEGVRVDGMDPLAVYDVVRSAVERARAGKGPTLIEAVQYRFGAHTTAVDQSAYRSEEEVKHWKERDPLDRTEAFLRKQGVLDDDRVAAIRTDVTEPVDELVAAAESMAEPDPDRIFEFVYDTIPRDLVEQRDSLRALRERHGDEAIRED